MAHERVGSARLPCLRAVGLRVGSQAGLVVENLEFCLEVLLSQPPFQGARPEVERCPGDVLQLEYLVLDEGSEGGAAGEEPADGTSGADDESGGEEARGP